MERNSYVLHKIEKNDVRLINLLMKKDLYCEAEIKIDANENTDIPTKVYLEYFYRKRPKLPNFDRYPDIPEITVEKKYKKLYYFYGVLTKSLSIDNLYYLRECRVSGWYSTADEVGAISFASCFGLKPGAALSYFKHKDENSLSTSAQ